MIHGVLASVWIEHEYIPSERGLVRNRDAYLRKREEWRVFHFNIHTHARFNPIINADNAREILSTSYSCTSFLLDQTISHIHFTVVQLFIILFSKNKITSQNETCMWNTHLDKKA